VTSPFAVLGLDHAADLTDDEVRAAWRRIAAATHPDRADGGNPESFARAAAAYTELRTQFGRNEARASLTPAGTLASGRTSASGGAARLLADIGPRLLSGRPIRLLLRVIVAGGAVAVVVLAAGRGAAAPALTTGVLTWLVLTARHDLGPPSAA
jgi:hypothetical protein